MNFTTSIDEDLDKLYSAAIAEMRELGIDVPDDVKLQVQNNGQTGSFAADSEDALKSDEPKSTNTPSNGNPSSSGNPSSNENVSPSIKGPFFEGGAAAAAFDSQARDWI